MSRLSNRNLETLLPFKEIRLRKRLVAFKVEAKTNEVKSVKATTVDTSTARPAYTDRSADSLEAEDSLKSFDCLNEKQIRQIESEYSSNKLYGVANLLRGLEFFHLQIEEQSAVRGRSCRSTRNAGRGRN